MLMLLARILELSIASFAAIVANLIHRGYFALAFRARAGSHLSGTLARGNFLPLFGKVKTEVIPEWAQISRRHDSSTEQPKGLMVPSPVTTTRLPTSIKLIICSLLTMAFISKRVTSPGW